MAFRSSIVSREAAFDEVNHVRAGSTHRLKIEIGWS